MNDAVTKFEGAPAPQVAAADPMLSMIERVVRDPSVPFERLDQMLAMQERMLKQQAEQAFNADFAAASAEIPTIPLNGRGHNGRPYATLKDIVSKTRPVLARHGLSLTWDVQTLDGKVRITAILSHTKGHTRRSEVDLPADTSGSKNAVQAIGSTQSYGMRYTAQAILGLSLGEDVDDDGNASQGTITEEQYIALRDLCEKAKADEGKLLAYFKVDHLGELPAKRYAEADRILRRKISERGAA